MRKIHSAKAFSAILSLGAFLGLLAPTTVKADSATVVLQDPNLNYFYPSQQNPAIDGFYKQMTGFPATLSDSIQKFTADSLKRDGINNVSVSVDTGGSATKATITFSGSDSVAVKQAASYAAVLPAFASSGYAGLGLAGAQACNGAPGCWNPYPTPSYAPQPWAFYLPLGLSMVNQKAVMLLNYPPNDALCSTDYLSNFTMARWDGVLKTVGITDTSLYETIVDVHPIAAPGSNQSTCIAKTTKYFYDSTKPNYDVAMLNLLLSPPGSSATTTVPLQVAGTDALAIWGSIMGTSTPKPGTVGTYVMPSGKSVPWVATNHPDVTSYQRCPGDPATKSNSSSSSKTCPSTSSVSSSSSASYTDDELVKDELLDLQAACVLKTLSDKPGTKPEDALAACKKVWCVDDSNPACQKQAVCVQARMDYDYKSDGHCNCQAAAQAFCAANNNNACPSSNSLTSCEKYNDISCPSSSKDKTKSKTATSYATCASLSPTTTKK
jgi:hypothetical protein